MALFIQVAVWGAMVAYLVQCLAYMRRRNRATWESLADRLRSNSDSDRNNTVRVEVLAVAAQELQSKPCDSRRLWRHFSDARVVLEMADYAERNKASSPTSIDPVLLASVRREAMQLRLSAIVSLAKCMFLPRNTSADDAAA